MVVFGPAKFPDDHEHEHDHDIWLGLRGAI